MSTITRNTELIAMAALCAVGDKIWFKGEKLGYTVQARSDNFLVCTKPLNPARTVLYCIVDLNQRIRGPENLVFGAGFETRDQCEEAIRRLTRPREGDEWPTEVSHRRRVELEITRLRRFTEFPQARRLLQGKFTKWMGVTGEQFSIATVTPGFETRILRWHTDFT